VHLRLRPTIIKLHAPTTRSLFCTSKRVREDLFNHVAPQIAVKLPDDEDYEKGYARCAPRAPSCVCA